MLEIEIAGVSFFIGLLAGGVVCFFVREKWLERKIARLTDENTLLDEELYSYQQKERNTKGIQVKQEKAERMQAVMLEFAAAMKAGRPPQEILQELASKYPDVAMELVKKGIKL